ncbi:hypothetical protein AB4527_13620 [Vibrio breoganii]
MKITKTAIAVAISSAFLFGCDFDVGSENNATGDTGGGTGGGGGLPPVENAENYVQIQDSTDADTGFLSFILSDPKSETDVDGISVGYLTVDLTFQDNSAINDGDDKAGYIQVHAGGPNNADLRGDLIFLTDGRINYRDSSGSQTGPIGSFTPGKEFKALVSWTENDVSFSIDGQDLGTYEARQQGTAVDRISLKVGDQSTRSNFELLADNLMIFKGDESNNELIFEDDFNQYGVGDDLTSSLYSTVNDVMIFGTGGTGGGEDGNVDTPSGKYVALYDNNTDDAGELRFSLDNSERIHEQGKASAYIRNSSDQTALMNVYGVDTGEIISVRVRENGKIVHRPQSSGSEWVETGTTVDALEWNKVGVEWDTNAGDDYKLYINDQLIGEYQRRITTASVSTRYVAVQVGTGNSNIIDNGGTVDVDNLALYSDTAGTAELHTDDFEGFAIGTDLGAESSTHDYDKSGYNAIVQE